MNGIYYAVFADDGRCITDSISSTEQDAKNWFTDGNMADWKIALQYGYTCSKIQITKID